MSTISLTNKYAANIFTPFHINIVQGEGSYVFDENGDKYIDMATGISSANFGHKNQKIINAVTEQLHKISVVPRLFYNEPLAKLLEKACDLTKMDKAIVMNSGAEAIETAIKVIRKWGYVEKKILDNLAEIITFDNSFHGRTITAIGTSSNENYTKHFGPMPKGFISIPINDLNALKKAINENTAGIIIEPIQGEGGIIMPNDDYLLACQNICKENNVLYILDEIQTGMGRTGKNFAMEHYNLDPDGITLGKSLGGGVLAISMFLGKDKIMKVLNPGDHGSTFGGNPLASLVAYTSLCILDEENISENSFALGNFFKNELLNLNSHYIKEIRGKGLFIAIEIFPKYFDDFYKQLLDFKVLSVKTRNNTIRFLPPLNIEKKTILEAINKIKMIKI